MFEDRAKPIIGYFDPFGDTIPSILRRMLTGRYSDVAPDSYLTSPIKLGKGEPNSCVWIIEILRGLVTYNKLLPKDFDIEQAKIEHQQILDSIKAVHNF